MLSCCHQDHDNSVLGQIYLRGRFLTSKDLPRPWGQGRKFLPSLFCILLLCCDSEWATQVAVTLVVVSPIWTNAHWIDVPTTNPITSNQTANRWYQLPLTANTGCNHTYDLKVERLFIILLHSAQVITSCFSSSQRTSSFRRQCKWWNMVMSTNANI